MRLTPEERALAHMVEAAHIAGDHELPDLFNQYGAALDVGPVVIYLADLQQRELVPFLGSRGPDPDQHVTPLHIDATLGGRAFQHVTVLSQAADDGVGVRVWVPLLDGTERLGVVMCRVADAGALEAGEGALGTRLRTFASIAAELIMTKSMYGDTIVRLRRTSEMGLAAEKQWSLLPPLTFADHHITISGALEPAYEVAGDTLDYAVDAHTAHLAIFDAMGHGLRSAQLAALAVSAYRNARRGQRGLLATARFVEDSVAGAFDGDAFLTAQLAELETVSGTLTWVNAGHPDPLLLRDGRLVRALHAEPSLPIGLGQLSAPDEPQLGAETLEPGDLVLFYSDGAIEARSPSGEFFGVERLVELVTRHLAAGLPPPETMRRVIGSLLDHQSGQLEDDASMLLVQYRPDLPDVFTP